MFINGFLITLMVKIWYSKRLFVLIIGCNNLIRKQNYSRKQTELSLFANRSRARVTDLLRVCMLSSPRGMLRMLRFSPFAEKQHLLCYLMINLFNKYGLGTPEFPTKWPWDFSGFCSLPINVFNHRAIATAQLLFLIRCHTAWPMASLLALISRIAINLSINLKWETSDI